MLKYTLDDALVEVSRKDVDMRSKVLKEPIIAKIANLLVRQGNTHIPGFAVLPKTSHIVPKVQDRDKLQMQSNQRLLAYMLNKHPGVLRRQRWRRTDNEMRYQRDVSELRCFQDTKEGNGLGRYAYGYHYDPLETLFASIGYGNRKNIRGGTFGIFDLLSFAKDKGVGVRDILSVVEYHIVYPWIKSLDTINVTMRLDQLIVKNSQKYLTPIPQTTEKTGALVFFSNRINDGILHGSNRYSKINPSADPCRRFTYGAIGYYEKI